MGITETGGGHAFKHFYVQSCLQIPLRLQTRRSQTAMSLTVDEIILIKNLSEREGIFLMRE